MTSMFVGYAVSFGQSYCFCVQTEQLVIRRRLRPGQNECAGILVDSLGWLEL